MAIRLNPVLVLGNSLLRDSEAPICSQERSAAFPEPRSKRVPQLVRSTNYYSLLLSQVVMTPTEKDLSFNLNAQKISPFTA